MEMFLELVEVGEILLAVAYDEAAEKWASISERYKKITTLRNILKIQDRDNVFKIEYRPYFYICTSVFSYISQNGIILAILIYKLQCKTYLFMRDQWLLIWLWISEISGFWQLQSMQSRSLRTGFIGFILHFSQR